MGGLPARGARGARAGSAAHVPASQRAHRRLSESLRPRQLTGALAAVLLAGHLEAQTLDHAEWQRLLEARYHGPVAVPAEGLVLELDVARLTLRQGAVWLLAPLSSGAVTGLVFEGDGRFEMAVPDAAELRQLRRFAENQELDGIDETVERVVLRTTERELVELLQALDAQPREGARGDYAPNPLALARQRVWLLHHGHDADARVIAALRTLGDRYSRADLKTATYGWLTFQYDAMNAEEIDLLRYSDFRRYPLVESWISLDRMEDRGPDGRQRSTSGGSAALRHLEVRADLRELGRGGPQGFGQVNPVDARFEVRARFEALWSGVGALQLDLDPMARLAAVRTVAGRELEYLRYPTGRLQMSIDNRRHNPDFVVLLDEPLARGQQVELDFVYELELVNYAPGLLWYPTGRATHDQLHTARLELEHRGYYDVCAMGAREDSNERTRGRSVWVISQPTKMIGFTFARWAHTRVYEQEGLPRVTLFGTRGGWLSKERLEEKVPDYVLGSLRYMSGLFGSGIETPELFVTIIGSAHGQAFRGMIQLDDYVYARADIGRAGWGTKQLFVAHEVAHQWWGHGVSWASYHDQWLSEALSEYSAMLWIEAEVEDGRKVMGNILEAFTDELNGSFESLFNPFSREGVVRLTREGRRRIGPIGHGYRSRTAETPSAYYTMAYRKGALVIHMIRRLLFAYSGSDEAFVGLLRELLEQYRSGALSNRVLAEALAKRYPAEDWARFFDQWIDGTGIPTYRFEHEVAALPGGGYELALEIAQEDVPLDFTAHVPVRVELEGGRSEERIVVVDHGGAHATLFFSKPPLRVTFNPDYSVLARMSDRSGVKAHWRSGGSSDT